MSRSKRGAKAPGFEYWTARPGNRGGGCFNPNGNKFAKRQTHKVERKQRKALAEGWEE